MSKNWHNKITYVQPGDAEAWVDWPVVNQRAPAWMSKDSEKCGICRGHGGWNLLLAAYPLVEGRDNTSENRHLFSHMRTSCHACSGHGWILTSEKRCVHEYRYVGVSDQRTEFSCVYCKHAVSWDVRKKN